MRYKISPNRKGSPLAPTTSSFQTQLNQKVPHTYDPTAVPNTTAHAPDAVSGFERVWVQEPASSRTHGRKVEAQKETEKQIQRLSLIWRPRRKSRENGTRRI